MQSFFEKFITKAVITTTKMNIFQGGASYIIKHYKQQLQEVQNEYKQY